MSGRNEGKGRDVSQTRMDNPHLGCRDMFIEGNLKLVYMVVNKYFKGIARGLNISLDDLYSEGFIGLLKAYDAFEPSKFGGRPLKFSTYAVPCIMGAVRRYMRDKVRLIRVPRSVQDILSQVVELRMKGSSVEEMAEIIQCSKLKVTDALICIKNQFPKELDEPLIQQDGSVLTVLDAIGKQDDLTGVFVQELLSDLNQRERLAVELRAQGYDQREIGDRLGMSQAHVSRILLKIKNSWMGKREGTELPNTIVASSKKQDVVVGYKPKKVERRDSVKTRKATPEELKRHNVQTIVDLADWFTDVKLPSVSSISITSQGISFNASAVEQMGLEKGMGLEVGYSGTHRSIVIRKSDQGAKLKQVTGQKSLVIVNRRLIDWLLARSVMQKRYPLEVDQLTGVWISKIELGTATEKSKGNVG
nr:sigma-70 family RNA polymerase sigma factor [Brevibacillus laterosporus]